MSKKLLSEAQVRRFQSLASIYPINEMESYNRDDEEVINEEDEIEADAEMDAPEEAEEAEEMELDAPAEEADVELDEELVQQFIDAANTIQQVADTLSGGAEDEDLAPVEDEAEFPPAAEEDEAEFPPAEEDEAEEEIALQEALKGISYVPSQKEIVKVVAKRVARRLQEAKIAQRRLNRALGKRK